jgi:hypothetical protein
MERSVAIKKLGKILGKSLGYRVDPKAPDEDERTEARAKLKIAHAERDDLDKQTEARLKEILLADTEYQRLKALRAEARKRCDELFSIANRYRFTVGTMSSLFFHVKAQGDSWEDVIRQLTEKQAA